MDEDVTSVIGPGAIQQQDLDIRPTLEGATEFEYVEVFNPLTQDFSAQYATTTPVKAPVNIGTNPHGVDEKDLMSMGISLRNPDYEAGGRSGAHIVTTSIIRAGQTKRFPGDKAQVVVRQLVSEVLQRSGKRLQMHDPSERQKVEQTVIRARGSIQEMLDGASIRTVGEQVDNVFTKAEQEFPEVNNEPTEPTGSDSPDAGGSPAGGDKTVQPERRTQSSPKRAEQAKQQNS